MAIQSNSYIKKIGICPECWIEFSWNLADEEYGYKGERKITCPICHNSLSLNSIIVAKDTDIEEGTPPITNVEQEQMITITFKDPDDLSKSATRQYIKGSTIQELPTPQDLQLIQFNYADFLGWFLEEYLNEDVYSRPLIQLPTSFNADITLYSQYAIEGQ